MTPAELEAIRKRAAAPLTIEDYRQFNEILTKYGREGDPMTYAVCLLFRHARMRDAEVERLHRESEAWQETARQESGNRDYFKALVVRSGEVLGEKAKTQDDGGKVPEVLCAKVPELVEELQAEVERLRGLLTQARTVLSGGYQQGMNGLVVDRNKALAALKAKATKEGEP